MRKISAKAADDWKQQNNNEEREKIKTYSSQRYFNNCANIFAIGNTDFVNSRASRYIKFPLLFFETEKKVYFFSID